MDRRRFLAGTLALASGALFLNGCGSGGSSGEAGVRLLETRSAIQLPAGLTVPVAELSVATAYGQSTPQESGSFTVPADATAPMLTFLNHIPTGTPLLLGFVGEGTSGVSAKTTGAALLYISMGLGGLTPALQRQAIAALETHAAVASLGDVIARRIAVNPLALRNSDSEIAAAVKQAFETVTVGTRASRAVTRAEIAPIVGITQGDQSLARLLQTDDGRSVVPVNLGRRPTVAYTYRTGYQNDRGRTDLTPAARVDGPQELAAVTSWVGSAFSLGQLPAWEPVSGKPVSLTMEAGATKTFYETVILMASGKAETEPGFFSQARYASELTEWRSVQQRLNRHAWLSGILFDLVKSALGGAATTLSFTAINAIIAELEAIKLGASAKILEEAGKGAFGQATRLFMESMKSGSTVTSQYHNLAIKLVGRAEAAGVAAVRAQMTTLLIGLAELVLGVLAAAGTLLALGDLLTTYSDVMRSEKAALWNATLLKPSIALTPKTASIAAGDSVTFSASAVGVEDGNVAVTYRWKKSDPNSVLSERDWSGSPNVGNELETKTRVVELATTPSTQGTVTVSVEGFVGGKSLGVATATVTVDPKKRLIYGRYQTRVSENGGNVGAFIMVPRQPDAASYQLHAYGFNDTAYYGREIRRGISEPPGFPPPDVVQAYASFQTDSEFGLFLSGASGGSENIPEGKAWLDGRFAGMVVKVTVSLK
jgi:hypothetical protein